MPCRADPGWLVTVYDTAAEAYHHPSPVHVTGRPVLDRAHGNADLGDYPGDFVSGGRDEGTGSITAGPHAGACLNWSDGVGYRLDTAARDAHGRPPEPFRSAARTASPTAPRCGWPTAADWTTEVRFRRKSACD